MQLAESTDNASAFVVLRDISDEEKVHVGEFLEFLRELTPDEFRFYQQGEEEVREMMKKNRSNKAHGKQGPAEDPKSEIEKSYCTTAADPEHARSYQEDEPCDDARAVEIGEDSRPK